MYKNEYKKKSADGIIFSIWDFYYLLVYFENKYKYLRSQTKKNGKKHPKDVTYYLGTRDSRSYFNKTPISMKIIPYLMNLT